MNYTGAFNSRRTGRRALALLAICMVVAAPMTALAAEAAPGPKIAAELLEGPARAETTFWVTFKSSPNLSSEAADRDWRRRGQRVIDKLKGNANASQAKVVALLKDRGAARRSFWIANTMQVTGDRNLMTELARRPEVESILPDEPLEVPPLLPADPVSVQAIEWGIEAINADDAWNEFSARGDGIVIANIDTGVQYDHPALAARYRGNLGGSYDHNHNWFDPARVCSNPSSAPCDNSGHGTHTMGTMLGHDPATGDQIGVAPNATWIAAKGCESTSCSQASLLASGQWILAPTNLAGGDPRPDLRPSIVNNSWGGGGGSAWYQDIVTAWVAAGIFPAFSNGNSGSSCGTSGSPGDYTSSYSAGAYAVDGTIAGFSSRGSATAAEMKPNIAAPGVAVRSSVPGNSYSAKSGTSMASPHVAGAVALMWSVAPTLIGDIGQTREILDETALDTPDLTCGGTDDDNGVWGEGKLDARAAVEASPRGPSGTLQGSVWAGDPAVAPTGAVVHAAGPTSRTTTVKSDGTYQMKLPVGTYLVTVNGFGLIPLSLEIVTVESETTVQDFNLARTPAHRVNGTVVDGSGTPLAGVKVSLGSTPLAPRVTGSDGAFVFEGVPEGSYEMAFDGQGCYGPKKQSFTVDGAETLDLALSARTDSFGYICSNTAPDYMEAATVTTLTGLDKTLAVPLPFPFSFYGTSYGSANVSTHGFITFGAASTRWTNGPVPETSAPNAAIYAYWDDLYPDAASSIRIQELGAEPNRRFVIEWRNVKYTGDSTRRLDFEMVLHQSGLIDLQYRNVDDDARERGSTSTIGIENAAGTVGLQYSHNVPQLRAGASGIRLATQASRQNTAPNAVDDSATVTAGSSVVIPVLGNDYDPEGDDLKVTAVSKPSQGTATIDAAGTVTYTPSSGMAGSDFFTYDIADGKGGTDRAAVSVGVNGNHAPVAAEDARTTAEDTPVDIDPLANDSDPDGDTLTLASVSNPSRGSAVIQPGGRILYTPDLNLHGADQFTYQVTDGRGGSTPGTVGVTVEPVNDPPVALPDAETFGEDGTQTVAVLDNDRDPDGDVLKTTIIGGPSHGSASVLSGKQVNYVPAKDFNGVDTVQYRATDPGGLSATASVTFTVTPVNDKPLAGPDYAEVFQGKSVDLRVLDNDTDAEGDALTVTAVATPSSGSAVINPDGTLRYSSNAGYVGRVTFSYTVSDPAGATGTGTVNIDVVGPQLMKMPMTTWSKLGISGMDVIGSFVVPMNDPSAAGAKSAPYYRYSQTVWFSDLTAHGTMTLGKEGTRKFVEFTVTHPGGRVEKLEQGIEWQAGQLYFIYLRHAAGGRWEARMVDGPSGNDAYIGSFQMKAAQQTVYPVFLTYLQWTAAPIGCGAYPLTSAIVIPLGYQGGRPVYPNAFTSVGAGDCESLNLSTDVPPYTFGYFQAGSP
jgi:subtilisin family serine protease